MKLPFCYFDRDQRTALSFICLWVRLLPVVVASCLIALPGISLGDDPTEEPSGDGDKPFGIEARTWWTTSRVVGSPDPPLPYTTSVRYAGINWNRPIYAKAEPGTDNLIVIEQGDDEDRSSFISRVEDDRHVSVKTSLLEIPGRVAYGLTFHPRYDHNGFLYLFSNGPTGEPERKNRISRFTVGRDGEATCDPASELVILEWRSMGHDGGELAFGRDGMLYISSGDGTSDSDGWLSAQDISNLLGGVLRIDVDRPTDQQPYSIPADNPFVSYPGARGELWAIGLRNPWRLCADQATGQVWVGNNGQDLWETAHLIRRGENYGWSVYEGSHPFYLNRQRGPAPIVAPTIEHHHTQFRSLTGGVVYRGSIHPELDGAYLYGDYSTGKIWGALHDGEQLVWHRELADTTHQIAGFAISPRGALLVADHGGAIVELITSPPSQEVSNFPRRLSETGLFLSTASHTMQPGVIPYSVNAPAWADGATAQRYLALPGSSTMDFTESRGWNLPEGSVLVQTLTLGTGESARRIETRLLTRQQQEWVGYSYRWNNSQDDADLVERDGAEVELASGVSGEAQVWRFPSRTECMSCHSRAVNFVLSMSAPQINRDHDYGDVVDNQLRTWSHLGLFTASLPKPVEELPRLTSPYDDLASVEDRARAYLHTNCSACHVEAGGGNARMELEFSKSLGDMRLLSARPQHETFGITNAMLIAPSDPARSVLLQRVSRRGRGQMPPLVSRVVDQKASELIHAWISQMSADSTPIIQQWTVKDLQGSLEQPLVGRSFAAGEDVFRRTGCIQCHRMGDQGGGAGPDLTRVQERLKPHALLEEIIAPSLRVRPEFATTVVVTEDGLSIQGRVESEDAEQLVIRTTDSFAEPKVIPLRTIEHRGTSPVSAMPAGMVDVCEQEEILDLLAYLLAGGDPEHASFASPVVEE